MGDNPVTRQASLILPLSLGIYLFPCVETRGLWRRLQRLIDNEICFTHSKSHGRLSSSSAPRRLWDRLVCLFVCVFLFVYLFTLFIDTYKSAVIETVIKVHIHNAIGPEKMSRKTQTLWTATSVKFSALMIYGTVTEELTNFRDHSWTWFDPDRRMTVLGLFCLYSGDW